MRILRFVCLLCGSLALTLITGCTLGPDYEQPQQKLPENWSSSRQSQSADAEVLEKWWQSFDDPKLCSLIEQADADNPDLAAAVSRIEQSRAMRAYASGEKLPSVDITGSYKRSRYSENALTAAAGEHSLYSTGFDAFWELDMFGRIKRSIESAQAKLEQSVEDYRNVRVSLYGELARNYIDLRTAQARIKYAESNISLQEKTLELTKKRFESDIVPQLDVAQARLNLANTRSVIPTLRIAETQAINRLAVLAGTTAHSMRDELLEVKQMPTVNPDPAAGVPAELLRRRPDIRSAERALAAQNARIGQAEAARYPAFSLSGTLGFEASHISDLGDWDSRAFAFGPDVRWNIFDGNRLESLVAAEEALTRQLAAQYESTVLKAVEEVENALIGIAQERLRAKALRKSVKAAKDSVRLVETLYRNGLTDFQNVLDTQRSLSQQQDNLAVSEGLILKQTVALYKALGGGWQREKQSASSQ